jgi:hypothetical protein
MRMLRLATFLLSLTGLAHANPAFEGDWMIEIRPPGAPVIGVLQLERNGDEWAAWVEGGPAPVTIDGDQIIVDIDSRDIRGFIFIARLNGTLEGDRISGNFTVHSDANVPFKPGTWSGERHVAAERPSEPDPVNLSGIWKPAPGVDIRKYSMDLTAQAQAWHDGYLMHYDQPNVRCISPGIVAMVAWGGYPFEVVDGENRLTFLYEVDSEVRRVWLDGREPPEFYPPSGMGYSTGHWEGSALVIETTNLQPNVRDFRGEPVSENALMHEVYTLSEDGQRLEAVITLHDPENYKRPPVPTNARLFDAGRGSVTLKSRFIPTSATPIPFIGRCTTKGNSTCTLSDRNVACKGPT